MRTEVGKPYSEAVVEQDIRNLYKMGELQNVRIFGRQEGDGVGVSVIVQARAIVTAIVINGVHQLKPRKVRDEIKFKLDRPVSEQALEEGRQKIVDLYQRLGFTEVSVHYRLETDESHGTTQAIYDIDEGERGMINAVRFEGNHAFSERTLRHQMKTKPKTIISFLDKSGRLEETQFQEDLDSIRAWYQDHGYVDVEIKDVRKERTKGHLALVIVVNEGTRYHVGKIRISGYHVTSESKIRALLKMKEGDIYSPKALKGVAKNIADAYGAGGFVDVSIVPQSIPSAPGRIDIDYKIEEGVRSFVQRINIVGNTRTKDKVLRREVLIVPGDVYNTVRVETSQKRLENLGYFSKVETYPEDSEVPGRKDLTIEVAEKRTGSLNFGAGFSTIDSLVGFVELSQGNFDLMNWPTFTGGGQKFRLRIQYGTERKDFLLALSEPYFLDRVLSLGGQAFYSDATYLSSIYSQRDYGFAVDLSKPITPFLSVSVDYRLEDLEIYNVAAGSSSEILAEEGSTVKSEVSFTLVWDTRDNPFLTRTGHRISFTPYIAGGFLGGDTQIYGFEFEAAQYFHLWWDTILLLNGEIASVDTWPKPSSRTRLNGIWRSLGRWRRGNLLRRYDE
jgi:outer membrane protein insertion porin family